MFSVTLNRLQEVLDAYTQHGYRLLAVASRVLDLDPANAQRINRESVSKGIENLKRWH